MDRFLIDLRGYLILKSILIRLLCAPVCIHPIYQGLARFMLWNKSYNYDLIISLFCHLVDLNSAKSNYSTALDRIVRR